jgi:hypothetical protein
MAQERFILTEAQLAALEKAKAEKEVQGEFETECPGYCGAQDTFYVGTLKGVGRVYQQTFIDTYAKVGFALVLMASWRRVSDSTCPSSNLITLSQMAMVESRCATMRIVRSQPRDWIAWITAASGSLSSALVASPNTRTLARL